MDPKLEPHLRYLTALRNAARRRPFPHACQLAALEREIVLAVEAPDAASYLRASGDLFELTRAGWLDRLANGAKIALSVGDDLDAAAAALEFSRVAAVDGPEEWLSATAAASVDASRLTVRSAAAKVAFRTVVLALIDERATGSAIEAAQSNESALGALEVLREADPAFAWDGSPRYALRVPWTGQGRELAGAWFADLGGTSIDRDAEADPLGQIASAQRGWSARLADIRYATTTAVIPDLADEYPDPAAVAAAAAAPLRARAEQSLVRQMVWPDPLVEHHWRSLLGALDDAATTTEVDLIAAHAQACLAVEADWNTALLATLLWPLRAAARFGWEASAETRLGAARASSLTRALLGVGPRRLFAVERVAGFVAGVLVPLASEDREAFGAYEGEAGFEALAEARAWLDTIRRSGGKVPGDLAELVASLVALLDHAAVAEPPARSSAVTLWGKTIHRDALIQSLARPERPPIPGFEPVPAAEPGL